MPINEIILSISCVILLFTAVSASLGYFRTEANDWIVGGEEANLRDYPYIVSIQSFYSAWEHSCGGYIVTPKIVLTACHCVYTQRRPLKLRHPSYSRILGGQGNLEVRTKHRQVRQVKRFVPHPDCGSKFKGVAMYHDVAAVILKNKFSFNPLIQPVKVFTKDPAKANAELQKLVSSRALCHSPGWGLNNTRPDTISPQLKVAKKNLMSSENCKQATCHLGKIFCIDFLKNDQLCAVGKNSSVCGGDSGGPLICNGYLFGSVSYGKECKIGVPQVYSTIVPILDFVNSID